MEISITTTFSIDCEVQKTFNSVEPIIIAFAKILEKLPEDFCVQSHANVILFLTIFLFPFLWRGVRPELNPSDAAFWLSFGLLFQFSTGRFRLLLISLLQFGLQFDGFLRALGGQLMLPSAFEIFRAQSFPLDSKVQAFDG